jgi:hypothetical protein
VLPLPASIGSSPIRPSKPGDTHSPPKIQVITRLFAGGGSQVRTRLKSQFHRRTDEFLESIKKGLETSDPDPFFS